MHFCITQPLRIRSTVTLLLAHTCDLGPVVMCTGETSVKHFTEHRGHACELAHLRLTSAQRQTAAGLMAVGMPLNDVLDHMQLSGGSDNIRYLHLATRKDMDNIKCNFNISREAVLHKNDADSVAAWVTEQQEGGQNIVRFIKFQGDEGQVDSSLMTSCWC